MLMQCCVGDALVYHGLTGLSMARLFEAAEPVCRVFLCIWLSLSNPNSARNSRRSAA